MHGLERFVAVDLLEQVVEAVATVHHLGAQDVHSVCNVLVTEFLVNNNTWVNIRLGKLIADISPFLEVTVVHLALVDGVVVGDRLGSFSVPGPIRRGHGKVNVATVGIGKRVPHGVQVGCTANVGQVLEVATGITVGVAIRNLGGSVEGLVDIASVVDNQAESERSGVLLIREVVLNSLVVVAILVGATRIGEPFSEAGQSVNDVLSGLIEGHRTIRVVGLVLEVPWGLEAVALAFDVVSEGSALSHWVVTLILGKRRIVLLEGSKLSKHSLVGSVVLRLEKVLSAS